MRVWLVLVILPVLTGCATRADLDNLRRDLASEIAAVTAQTQSDLKAVRDKADAVQSKTLAALEAERKVMEALQGREEELEARVEALTSKVASVNHGLQGELAELRKILSDLSAKRAEDVAAIRATVNDIKQHMLNTQDALAAASAESRRLQTSLRSLTTAIVRRFQSEAEGLRRNLKEIELVAKELDTSSPPPSQTPGEPGPSR
jgi:chromosome segregation ATPase